MPPSPTCKHSRGPPSSPPLTRPEKEKATAHARLATKRQGPGRETFYFTMGRTLIRCTGPPKTLWLTRRLARRLTRTFRSARSMSATSLEHRDVRTVAGAAPHFCTRIAGVPAEYWGPRRLPLQPCVHAVYPCMCLSGRRLPKSNPSLRGRIQRRCCRIKRPK